jgi:agmatinase
MIQIGIRSPCERAVYDWTLAQGVRIVTAEEVHESGPRVVAEQVHAVLKSGPAYLSFDIDAIDPGQAPGTGTPEVGGLFTWQVMAILKRLAGIDFRGMDLVEVAPAYDQAEITALAGSAVIWQYLCLQPFS